MSIAVVKNNVRHFSYNPRDMKFSTKNLSCKLLESYARANETQDWHHKNYPKWCLNFSITRHFMSF